MFTFLHAADIHLDSPLRRLDAYAGAPAEAFRQATRRALEKLVETAVREKVAFVLIAGDLYDGDWRDYNTGLFLVAQMARLREAGIRVMAVAGNHDAASTITRTLRLPDNVHLFAADAPETVLIEEPPVAVHGQSFARPAVTEDLARRYPPARPGRFNIGLLHTCVSGREGHAPYAPCTVDALRAKGYDYWALGHVHRHEVLSEDPPVVFAGNLQGRHARETGPKGAVRVRVDERMHPDPTFIALDAVRWETLAVDAAGADSGYAVMDRFRRALRGCLGEHPEIPLAVRVSLSGKTAADRELRADPERWRSEIRAAALEAGEGRVWVEKIAWETAPEAGGEPDAPGDAAVAELLRCLDALAVDPDALAALGAELGDLVQKLPEALCSGAEGFRPAEAEWMAALLQEVRPLLLERLLRRGDGP